MRIARDFYLQRLRKVEGNGLVKVITGVRRCGKSFLLFTLFREELRRRGVDDAHVVAVQLDDEEAAGLRLPRALSAWIRERLPGDGAPTYVLIDEIQMCKPPPEERGRPDAVTFYDVLSSLMKKPGVDVYVTGSNSETLSRDVATNFRDRGIEIRVWPLSFSECLPAMGLEKAEAWERYLAWGGMPLAVLSPDDAERSAYLGSLFSRIYLKDITERWSLAAGGGYALDALVDVLCSGVGSLTNPARLADALRSERRVSVSRPTVASYIGHLEDAFLFTRADRWDVRGRRHLASPSKYYSVDLGLRNARLNFRQHERGHLMENAVFNELRMRGYGVDVGVVSTVVRGADGRSERKTTEIDFVATSGPRRVYIQSAFAIPDETKRAQETYSLRHTGDFFRKIVVENGFRQPMQDESGVTYVGAIPFLTDPSILESLM
jgi:hypothetical protein